jgi:DNA polymerase-3 subunit delta'
VTLPGIDEHPHARALLVPALPPGEASHAYLFHGPAGAGKREIARAFATALLADGAGDAAEVAERVARGTHPDLTWVTPSGAAEMLVADIDEPVVMAAARTPFESRRRVFVIEQAETMHDATANRLLKTLEEPASFVHLILITARVGEVLPTVASRCQLVRFEAPSAARLAQRLAAGGVEPAAAEACARLALGDGERAAALAFGDGPAVRHAAEAFAVAALAGELGGQPWQALLELSKGAGERTAAALEEAHREEAEFIARSERARHEREHGERVRRAQRRGSAATLDLGLGLVELWYRDAGMIADGASDLVYALDRMAELEATAAGRTPRALHRALELVVDSRERLALNVTEELTLEALAYRIAGDAIAPPRPAVAA